MKIISNSIDETNKLAEKWLGEISAQTSSVSSDGEAMVVGLCGHLGSGKTVFVQALGRALKIKEQITSPTFVIMKIYQIVAENIPWQRLVHIDAYRLEKPQELQALEFETIVANPRNLVLIEWADNVETGLPTGWRRIDFKALGEKQREIEL